MFGGEMPYPRCAKKEPRMKPDILLPGIRPGTYQHVARQPNTDCFARLQDFKRKKEQDELKKVELEMKRLQNDSFYVKYEVHSNMKHRRKEIDERVKDKMRKYDATIEERRERLQDMLCKEEREYYYETVENAQKGQEEKMEELKKLADTLKQKREEERLKVVHEKRIIQYRNRCQELRPALMKKHLMETKYGQLQQIRENEARRNADRELENMWNHISLKEQEAKKEREIQVLLQQKKKQKELMDVWDKQIKGKELLKEECEKVAQEDRIEMIKLSEQLRREEMEALEKKRLKRERTEKELLEQIANQEQFLAQRKKQEEALDEAFNKLTQMEIDNEKAAIQDNRTAARRETIQYRAYLKKLEEQRKEEDKQLTEVLQKSSKELERKQDEAKCKLLEAKRKLQEDVLAGRAEQLQHKKEEAEQQKKLKEIEDEMMRMMLETNKRLHDEFDRTKYEAERLYRDDLSKQIEYSALLKKREREELERQLKQHGREEEKYNEIVKDMLTGDLEDGTKHPFRRLLERPDCVCPPRNS